jgi:N-formylmaleamate deformylase
VGQGPPILFLPGLASPGEVWNDAVAHLRTRYRCHVFTLAGFAGQPPLSSSRPFLARERDAILDYIREQRLDRPILVGHSLGAFLAFWIASQQPDRIGGIFAIDGVPFLPALGDPDATSTGLEAQADQMRDHLAALSPAAFARQNRAALAAMITRPEDVERMAAWGARSDPGTTANAIFEMMTTDLRPQLARLAAPVWLVVAGAGPGFSEQVRVAFADQIANAPSHRIIVAERARHFVMLDDPGFLHATLDAFLGVAR